jgi:alpha-glucosidase
MPRRRLMSFFALSFGVLTPAFAAAADVQVASPDGSVRFTARIGGARPTFTVTFRDKSVLEPSPLAMAVDGTDITATATAGTAERYQIDETYPTRGVHSRAVNRCNGARIPLTHAASGMSYSLDVRVFNDAAAFRFVVPGEQKPRVPDEATTFVLPAGGTGWHQNPRGHYEGEYRPHDVAAVPAGTWAPPPFTVKLPNGVGYASITEANLVNYAGMMLQADGKRGFTVRLGHAVPASYPFELRYKEDVERYTKPASVTGTITTPWRVAMVGADLNALVNCDAVTNLCPPPDPKLFPKGVETEWLKPGRAVWEYLDGRKNNLAESTEFCRMAGELGFEHNVIEGYWRRWSDDELKGLTKFAKERGVGVWLWRGSKELRDPAARRDLFKRCREVGAVGVKLDFFDHEAKEMIDFYHTLLKETAEHQLMVNFHGANKPTGEQRTWPNEMTREAVRGMESSAMRERARHGTTLPFTRLLAGHADYTPVHFGTRRGDTTWAHQIATGAILTSPLLTYAASPRALLANPALEMIKAIPAVWDETIVLPPSEIGELAALARRRGDVWFVAVMNGPSAKTLRVPLTFLGDGAYRGLFVRDQKDDPATVLVENATRTRGDTLAIELRAGGGFVGRFAK